ncbi:MAG: hypothetical protein KBS70_03435 [Bacteroidales bacterium]|nr:hypothetical protein [Candidatus Colicola equi]
MTRLQDLAIIKVTNTAAHPDAPGAYISELKYVYVGQHIGFDATDKIGHAEVYDLRMAQLLSIDLEHNFSMFEFEVIKLG